MATSLRDVALRAGVSIKTVSNVVNDYPYISDATRTKALAVPELESPYFAELARETIKAAEKRRWIVLIDQTDGVRSRELEALRGLRNQLDGLIISPQAVDSQDLEEAGTMPVVVLGERVAGGTHDHVAVDTVGSTMEAVSHLVALGRTRIAAIGAHSAETTSTAHLRLAAYRRALEMHGLDAPRQLVRHAAAWHRSEGAAAMAALLDLRSPPDAVFCFNDLALRATRRRRAPRRARRGRRASRDHRPESARRPGEHRRAQGRHRRVSSAAAGAIVGVRIMVRRTCVRHLPLRLP